MNDKLAECRTAGNWPIALLIIIDSNFSDRINTARELPINTERIEVSVPCAGYLQRRVVGRLQPMHFWE
jgi:hypothetical protein